MIGKPEMLRTAGQMNLNPHVVEKDYALGWLLAGIFANDKIADSWVFKGGTCLKKCFFETYRFSEDLDFLLKEPDPGFSWAPYLQRHVDDAAADSLLARLTAAAASVPSSLTSTNAL